MEQLYYTSCEAQRSLNGAGGYQVRAVSAGLPPQRLEEAKDWAKYALPKGYPDETSPTAAPTRLALLQSSGGERVLCHTTYVGIDPDTRRYGNFFSHLLFDLPPSHGARWALEAWGSRFWQTKDGSGGTALPDIHPNDLTGGVLNPSSITGYVRSHHELVRFLLRTLLADKRRVFVVAPAEAVAQALYAVLHVLWADTAAGLTFSTYESDPISCPAWVVGTWWKENQTPRDLDSQCYDGSGFGFNTLTGRQSRNLPPEPVFVGFALQALANNRGYEVTEFLHECQQVGVADAQGLDLAYRVLREPTLEAADLVSLADYPGLLTQVAARPGMLERITECGLVTPNARRDLLPKFAKGLGGAGAAQLADAIWQRGLAAIRGGDVQAARAIWEEGLQAVDPRWGTSLGAEVRKAINPKTLSPEMRLELLPLVLQNAPTGAVGAQDLREWLRFPSAQLTAALKVISGREVQRWAILASLPGLTPATASPDVLRVVHEDPKLLFELVADLYPGDSVLALEWFDKLAADTSSGELTDELFRIGPDSPTVFTACLRRAARAGWLDVARAIRDHTEVLLTALQPEVLAELVEQLLSDAPTELAKKPDVADFLQRVRHSPAGRRLNEATLWRLEVRLQLADFCDVPVLEDTPLRMVGEALLGLNTANEQAAAGNEITKRVASTLLQISTERDAKEALERVLKHLAEPIASPGWAGYFHQLLQLCAQDQRFWQAVPTVYAFLSVGFLETNLQNLPHEGQNNLMRACHLTRELLEQLRRKNSKAIDHIRATALKEWKAPLSIAQLTPCTLAKSTLSVADRLLRWGKVLILGLVLAILVLAIVFILLWAWNR